MVYAQIIKVDLFSKLEYAYSEAWMLDCNYVKLYTTNII